MLISEEIQKEYVELLLKDHKIHGKILDVGCGTGNALSFIRQEDIIVYNGIDLSKEMIQFAKNRFNSSNTNFCVGDFLKIKKKYILANYNDYVICSGALHWFRPHEVDVMNMIYDTLKPKGKLLLSFAADFNMIQINNNIKRCIIKELCKKYNINIPSKKSFKSIRFNDQEIKNITKKFTLVSYEHIEKKICFSSYEKFKSWNLASGLYFKQYIPIDIQEMFVDDYFHKLYKEYIIANYNQRISLVLLSLEK
ncbi:MAG: methyltransferase domain-containing protein [Candidatus Delongbacteria bacterium]|nr:methyltransferase domain-containing protein [Candidatus Delongbacteria bacterium]